MKDVNSFAVGIDFEHILAAISKQIYETPLAFLRENVQNAIDAIRIQARRDNLPSGDSAYKINVDIESSVCSIRDNGIGMTKDELQRYFWTIGASGKRNEEAKNAGCVGMFGIGGFANLGVCSHLEVISQSALDEMGTQTSLAEADIRAAGGNIPQVKVAISDRAAPRGTLVIGHLREAPNLADLRSYLLDSVQFAEERVYFNGELLSTKKSTSRAELQNSPVKIWELGAAKIEGRMGADSRSTLEAELTKAWVDGSEIKLSGRIRFESGALDIFKRGFKLCATRIPTQIGVSGTLDCDSLSPTAGRDSLDASSNGLLNNIVSCLERAAIMYVLKSPDLISQHTRIFSYIVRHSLIGEIGAVAVRLADGTDTTLYRVYEQSQKGVSVLFGTKQNQSLLHIMQARGNVVVMLDADRNKQSAEKSFLLNYCKAKPFEGVVECSQVYGNLDRFEQAFLSELETIVGYAYELRGANIIAGKLTEDIPVFLPENSTGTLEIYVDVRHTEIQKLRVLGVTPIFYSMVSAFCAEYLGPSLRKKSPKYFGDGAINLDALAKKRSELWILLQDDVKVISKVKRDVVRSTDVHVFRVGAPDPQPERIPKIIRIIADGDAAGLAGCYIRIPDSATKAFGDLVKECKFRAVVWAGNKILFVASDGVSSSFQFEIRLDELISSIDEGRSGMEGAADLSQPLQELQGGLYFPFPAILESSLVPQGSTEIRIEVRCEWLDMQTSKVWHPAGITPVS